MAASAPRFSKPPAVRQTPDDAARLFLECQVQGTPKPDITWFRNEKKLDNTTTKHKQTIKVATGTTYDVSLEILKLSPEDAGTYKILAKNRAGESAANVTLNLSNDDDDDDNGQSKTNAKK